MRRTCTGTCGYQPRSGHVLSDATASRMSRYGAEVKVAVNASAAQDVPQLLIH